MKKATKEGILIARYISSFLNEYVPSQKTDSAHTIDQILPVCPAAVYGFSGNRERDSM